MYVPPRIRILLALLSVLLSAASAGSAQGLPEFAPLNPMASSRSGLYYQPYRDPAPGWITSVGLEYASLIEYNQESQADYVLDSELLRLGLGLSRDLGRNSSAAPLEVHTPASWTAFWTGIMAYWGSG